MFPSHPFFMVRPEGKYQLFVTATRTSGAKCCYNTSTGAIDKFDLGRTYCRQAGILA
jgi:hypothetical protein